MSKQTFTTGQVLTAAQMTSLQQTAMGGGSTTAKVASYVLVAADAGTVVQMNAAGATTITVDTALFAAGDSVQIQNIGAGVCTVTAGTATVSTAGSLALSQYEGGQLYFNTTSAALFFDIVQTSGMTNPMTTAGDIIYSSSGSTPARLGIGTTGQVVTVASGIPSWATPSSGALTLITRQTFTGVATTGTTFDGVFTSTYKNYLAIIETCFAGTSTDDFQLQLRYAGPLTQATDYLGASQQLTPPAAGPITGSNTATQMTLATNMGTSAAASGSGQISFGLVGNSSQSSIFWGQYVDKDGNYYDFGGKQDVGRTYTGFLLKSSSSNITGTVAVYGMATA